MDVIIQVLPSAKKKIKADINNRKRLKRKLLADPDNNKNLGGNIGG